MGWVRELETGKYYEDPDYDDDGNYLRGDTSTRGLSSTGQVLPTTAAVQANINPYNSSQNASGGALPVAPIAPTPSTPSTPSNPTPPAPTPSAPIAPIAPTSSPVIPPVGDAPPTGPDVAALPVAKPETPKEPERPTTQPVSPPTKVAPTPWETPDPLAFAPVPSVPTVPTPPVQPTPPLAVAPPPVAPPPAPDAPPPPVETTAAPSVAPPAPPTNASAGFSPDNRATVPTTPSTPTTPTPPPPTAAAPTNPGDAFYIRDANGKPQVVSKAEYDDYMAHPERWMGGVGQAFKGTVTDSGGTSVYDPVHDRWYDPGLYQNAEQAQTNFNEASGPVAWAGDVLSQLGYEPTAQPATATQAPAPMPVTPPTPSPTPAVPPSGIEPNPTPIPPITMGPGNGLPDVPDAPPTPTTNTPAVPVPPPVSVPTPTQIPTDANGLPTATAGGSLTLTPTTPGTALTNSTITPGPQTDRYAIAQRKFDDWEAANAPKYAAAERDRLRYAAANGAIGQGATATSINDIAAQRETDMRAKRNEFLDSALTGSIEDAYRNIGIAQQQQGFQAGQQQTAFNQQVTLQQLADTEAGQTFQQLMTTMGFNAQQIQQAFENAYRVQQLSDDETGQAFYRALQQAMFGAQGDPADIYEWLAQMYALPQNFGQAA